jgi:hypothetical protein
MVPRFISATARRSLPSAMSSSDRPVTGEVRNAVCSTTPATFPRHLAAARSFGLLGPDRETCESVGDGPGSSSGSFVRIGRQEGRSPPPLGRRHKMSPRACAARTGAGVRGGTGYVLRPATTLTVTAMITASKTKDISPCRSAVARMAVFCRDVSDTWKHIPIVKAR